MCPLQLCGFAQQSKWVVRRPRAYTLLGVCEHCRALVLAIPLLRCGVVQLLQVSTMLHVWFDRWLITPRVLCVSSMLDMLFFAVLPLRSSPLEL